MRMVFDQVRQIAYRKRTLDIKVRQF